MSLSDEYKRQREWRPWRRILDELPPLRGQAVLDLGCSVGDQAAELVARGARVIGIDVNEELLRAARSRRLQSAEFHLADLRAPLDIRTTADGLWSSFVPAYFPDLPAALARWSGSLKPGGWVALTEVDDLFGHEPLRARARSFLDSYVRESLAAGRYDFHMGGKLRGCLEQSGFEVTKTLVLEDLELSFDGPARADVIEAWRKRFDRLNALRDLCGPEFEPLKEEFLVCLGDAHHRTTARVYCCVATKRAR